MLKLAAMMYVIVAPVVMGVLFTVTLFFETLYNGQAMTAAALIGALAAVPLSWLLAREMTRRMA